MTVTETSAPERAEPWRWTVAEVLRMLDVGLLRSDSRTELIDGELVKKAVTQNGPHVTTINRLTMRLAQASGEDFVVSVQNALVLGVRSMPEPDLVVHRAWDHDRLALPTVGEAVLVIEVADSSVGSDRRRKIPLYARHRCPELWFIDLVQRVLERHTEPRADGFASVERHDDGEIAPHLAPELRIDVAALLRGRTG